MTRHHDRLTRSRFSIGAAQVQPDRLIILFDGEEHSVEPKVMDVLVVLAENAGETLPTERIILLAWKSDGYGDNPVHKAINALRKVFADDPKRPRYIETIRGRGYRLIATVNFPSGYRRIQAQGHTWLSGSPYVGLDAFDASHADVFFGRSRTTADLLGSMRRQIDQQRRMVLVVGASGCGKTSLLRAGVIPLITNENGFDGLHALSVARCDLAGADGKDALLRLATALQLWTLGGRQVFPPQAPAHLAKTLNQHAESISETLAEAFRRHLSCRRTEQSHAHLLLVIDHAEALVARQPQDSEANAALDRIIHHLCDSSGICLVMIVREDFHHALAEAFPSIADRMSGDGYLPVLSPRAGEISDIIRVPAARAGLDFERHPENGIYLDDALLGAAASHPDILPLLQHTLQMLYERKSDDNMLRFSVYHEIGGLEGALAHHAERTFDALPEEIRGSLDQILSRIVVMQPENDSVSARRINRTALDGNAVALAESFAKARLFVAEQGEDGPYYRVTHEALLRQWPRALDWIRENRRLLLARIRLQRAADRWAEEGRRDDHLLNPGAPLEEAIGAASAQASCDGNIAAFLERSTAAARWKKRLRAGLFSMLALLTAASMLLSVVAMRKSEEAARRKVVAQDFIGFMLNDINAAIDPTGDLDLPERISRKALVHYRQMKPEEMEADDLSNFASALRGLGIVELSRNRERDSTRLFSEAESAAQGALALDPARESAVFELAQISYWRGQIHYNRNEFKATKRQWQAYLEQAKRLRALSPGNPKWIMEESHALNNLGVIALRAGEIDKAIALFAADLAAKQAAIALDPRNVGHLQEYADSQSWMASALEANGRIAEAASEYAAQIASLRQLVSKKAHHEKWKFRLANLLLLKAIVEMQQGHADVADRDVLESISILKALTQDKADRIDWRKMLARGLVIRAGILEEKRDLAGVLAALREASTHIDDAVRAGPLDTTWQRLETHVGFLRAIHDRHDTASADARIAQMGALLDRSFSNEIAIDHAGMLILAGRSYSASGDDARARKAWTQAIETLQRVESRRRADWNRLWIEAHWQLGRRGDVSDNVRWLQEIGYGPPSYGAMLSTTSVAPDE